MKIFRFLAVALVAMLGFTACEKDCGHEFIGTDYSNALVGTWTLMNEGFAEAWVVKADGSVEVTGVLDGEYYETKGTIEVKNNKMSYKFDNGDQFEGILDIIPGKCFSLAYESDYQSEERVIYQYCANDLSDEIVGMWVCTQSTAFDQEMSVNTYQEDGKALFTGYTPDVNGYKANLESTYKVIGDLLIQKYYVNEDAQYITLRLNYSPNATGMGDILTITSITTQEGQTVAQYASLLRIKQHLELPGNKYDYIKTFVTNVSGEDKDIPFLNTSFNFAKMDGSIIDKFLKSILFNVEFPNENTINYSFLLEGQNLPMSAPIEVEGNKMTIKMSANDPIFHDVVVYTFQDKDNSQMHMYMPTSSFEKFFANTSVSVMLGYGRLDKNDADAIAAVYQNVADAVHSINLSLVMSKSK